MPERMPTQLEILQGAMINTYLAATKLPAFKSQPYFVAGAMQQSFDWLWENNGKLSSGERLVFYVAKELWTWDPQIKIFDVCNNLSLDLIDLTFSLYKAWNGGELACIKWITENDGQQWLKPLIQIKE
jgi:hypothetical protein